MHKLYSVSPQANLREYVRAFAQRSITSSGLEVVQTIPPYLEHVIEFEFGAVPSLEFSDGSVEQAHRISVIGLIANRRANIVLQGDVTSFAIFFQPMGFTQLFRIPMKELAERFYNGLDLLGIEMQELWNKMALNSSFESRVSLAEEYLMKRASNSVKRSSIMNAALYMFKHSGEIRVDDVARQSSLSVRQFERRFVNEIGIPPKLFARVARFQMVVDAKISCRHCSWTNLAHKYGFHDQMHMIKDFHDLSGFSPKHLIDRCGDLRPVALSASEKNELPIGDYSILDNCVNFRAGCGIKTIHL